MCQDCYGADALTQIIRQPDHYLCEVDVGYGTHILRRYCKETIVTIHHLNDDSIRRLAWI